jgi:lysophospholipase L1-like esterase
MLIDRIRENAVIRLFIHAMAVASLVAACGAAGSSTTPRPTPSAAAVPTGSGPAVQTENPPSPNPNPTSSPSTSRPWSLVVVGDSIPFNSPDDCPGCTGFVDRYAAAITLVTGHPVTVQNLSQHNGLQIDGLLAELANDQPRRVALAGADIVVVSIGFNDIGWIRLDDTCDGPTPDTEPMDWTKYTAACGTSSAASFKPKLERIYADIVALRAGKPTILRTTNRYNDAIAASWSAGKGEALKGSRAVVEAWNAMACKAAQLNGFVCVDIYHALNGPDGAKPLGDFVGKDETHPSDRGNEVIAGVLTDVGYAPLFP